MKKPFILKLQDRVGILHRGKDTGKRGRVREIITVNYLVVDPEHGPDDNGHPIYNNEDSFFYCPEG